MGILPAGVVPTYYVEWPLRYAITLDAVAAF